VPRSLAFDVSIVSGRALFELAASSAIVSIPSIAVLDAERWHASSILRDGSDGCEDGSVDGASLLISDDPEFCVDDFAR